jgi:metallo-beta-lactamase family protein
VDIISGASAHADCGEILEWLGHFSAPPKKTFITHGEPEAATSLEHKIKSELGWCCVVPKYEQTELLR